ncbi:uncharacterized protein PHACADRAFT_191055 [Phanerochaete carnosa HHB-10118-sp]|uniref:Protein kinase domain-containing protein n=1 Tax=Phanerochaete carnosa (strain HHB-10118-sp) TaxID=650164 RepID=K5WRK1_PHACS|nr:uncharacterized protein PHACADRAFT_191055 [Phanerochaete carnosa HHB-10118-sp]EKM61864.1 hypothetical protein PHACADRAFT_191055 [Phanerochaete carnosa HHB-10118-sp]
MHRHQEIAEGTFNFGKVKMVIHTVTGHRVAMKFISKQVINATKTRTRMQREVKYMQTLRHAHIIKLYEVIPTPTDIVIVLEYADGDPFNYIVANGRIPEPRARWVFQQLISGIEYSHRLNIVRRDLKQENVSFADFGLSNDIKDGGFLNTSSYLSPDAKNLIMGMLAVGPMKRITVSEILQHPFFTADLPRYTPATTRTRLGPATLASPATKGSRLRAY